MQVCAQCLRWVRSPAEVCSCLLPTVLHIKADLRGWGLSQVTCSPLSLFSTCVDEEELAGFPRWPGPVSLYLIPPMPLICGKELLDLPRRFCSRPLQALPAKVWIRFPHLLHCAGSGTTSQVTPSAETLRTEDQVTS